MGGKPAQAGMKVLRIQRENATFQILKSLKTNRRKRMKRKEIFVESVSAINAAAARHMRARWIACAETRRLSDWARHTMDVLGPELLLKLSDRLMADVSDREETSELIAVFERPSVTLDNLDCGESPYVVVLDRPASPGNLGSVLRSCDAFDVTAVVTTGHGVDPYDPQAIRASLGAVFSLEVVHEPSSKALTAWIDSLRTMHERIEVVGTDSAGECSLRETKIVRPVVVLFGNEAAGLSVALKNCADRIVAIPIGGTVDSLNLACAASIILYSVGRDE
jgi:TrmH family RNA methyltransferase